MHNSIVAGNFTGTGTTRSDTFGSPGASTNNAIGVNTGSTFVNGVNGNIVGTAANPIDPRLGPLANNGGPTQTHALPGDSPAIDHGNNAVVTYTIDQRGAFRFADGPDGGAFRVVDIGAFEFGTYIPTIPDQDMDEDGTLNVPFGVGDASLPGLVVTATSDNPLLVPNDAAHLVVTGGRAARVLVLHPAADRWGDAIITVTATRGGESASTSFRLLVRPVNDVPLAAVDAYTTAEDTPLAGGSVLANDDDYHGGAGRRERPARGPARRRAGPRDGIRPRRRRHVHLHARCGLPRHRHLHVSGGRHPRRPVERRHRYDHGRAGE